MPEEVGEEEEEVVVVVVVGVVAVEVEDPRLTTLSELGGCVGVCVHIQ